MDTTMQAVYNELKSELGYTDEPFYEASDLCAVSIAKDFNCSSDSELIEKIKAAHDFNDHTIGRVIIYPTQDANELESLYFKYMALDLDNRAASDNSAREMFGKPNRDIYAFIKDNILKAKNDEIEDTHKPEQETPEPSIFANDLPLVTPEELVQKVHEDYSCFNEQDAESIKRWRQEYALMGMGIKTENYNKYNLERINILRRAIYNNNEEAIIQCGWVPGIEFDSDNRAKASKIIKEKMEKDYGIISEAKVKDHMPKKCTKCGSTNIGTFFKGEPIYQCKDCGQYLGTVPFPSKKNESYIEEASNEIPEFKSDTELSKFMKNNISYKNYTKLMSPEEVYETKKGSCHDQVMFELYCLRKLKLSPKALFLIEYNDEGKGTTNVTHSLAYYNKNNKIYWFENAWGGQEGIHEFDSIKDLKNEIKKLHDERKFGNNKLYPKLEITSFKAHTPGESLQQLVDICLDESCIEESSNNEDKHAVSIVLVSGSSILAKTIKKVQGTEFSHASIALDDDISKIYSYNMRNGFNGLTYESMKNYIKEGVDKVGVYTFLVSDKVYKALEKVLENFNMFIKDTKYSILNLFTIPLNIPLNMNMKMVCSEFVDTLLKAAHVDLTNKKSSLVSPKDFIKATKTNTKIVEVFNGHPKDFNPKEVEKKIKNLKKSRLPVVEFVEYDDIITEAKSFPVQFDSDGNLILKNIRSINFEQEYANSHRLLKEYEKTKSYEPMKFELAKMQFFITLLEKKIYKYGKDKTSDELKVRARFLNDFKKYLKIITTNEPSFNFTEYYEQSPFNDALIKIDKSTLKFGFEALKYLIK